MSSHAAAVTMTPGPRLMRNSQCQENQSVRYPPTVGPMVGASVATRPMIGAMNGCLERGKMVKAEANTVGIMPPPMKPCSARQMIISSMELAWAHMKLMSVKPPAEM